MLQKTGADQISKGLSLWLDEKRGSRQAETAIADIVDNSLSAGATEINISFDWGPPTRVSVTDNGQGMSAEALLAAMRFGSDPSAARRANDLGRFGLGLKTASLSQGRTLSVVTKARGNGCSTARWDLAAIEAADDWDLLIGPQPDLAVSEASLSKSTSGTVVVWDDLDVLLGSHISIDNLYEIAERVSRHLAITFHRFIERNSVQIFINGARVPAINPVTRSHDATLISERHIAANGPDAILIEGWALPVQALRIEDGGVNQAAILSIEQQGFYVYRNDRLISASGWLGFGRMGHADREECYRHKFNFARTYLDDVTAASSKHGDMINVFDAMVWLVEQDVFLSEFVIRGTHALVVWWSDVEARPYIDDRAISLLKRSLSRLSNVERVLDRNGKGDVAEQTKAISVDLAYRAVKMVAA